MNNLEFIKLLDNLEKAQARLGPIKVHKLRIRQWKMAALENFTIYSQIQKMTEEHRELKAAYDELARVGQTTLEANGVNVLEAARKRGAELALEIADCINVLESLAWLLDEAGLFPELTQEATPP